MRQICFYDYELEIPYQSIIKIATSLCFNHFSEALSQENVRFVKADFLHQEIQKISSDASDITLIVGNSDLDFGSQLNPDWNLIVKDMPRCVTKIYAANNILNQDYLENAAIHSLPIGLENYTRCLRWGHGKILSSGVANAVTLTVLEEISPKIRPQHLVYSGFTIRKNCRSTYLRTRLKKISDAHPEIYFSPAEFTDTPQFYRNLLSCRSVLCPDGNGVDTHRFYETLTLGRIPIVFNTSLHKNLYYKFPCVLIEDIDILASCSDLEQLIVAEERKAFDRRILKPGYWISMILNSSRGE